jgi:triosephosphate isomerase (TIM)
MHHDHVVALHTVRDLGLRLKPEVVSAVEVSIHPPFSDLRTVQVLVEGEHLPLAIGAQHCHPEDEGAFTGEVSAPMLARLGVRYVIVGHSERRRLFAMSDERVAETLRAVRRHAMAPILCIGESAEERDAGTTEARLARQLETALAALSPEEMASLVVAYEPIWAIGTGRTATAADADSTIGVIRDALRRRYADTADTIRIQYGGSVKPGNIAELMRMPEIDGALVGGASLDPDDFARIVQYAR